MNLTQIAVFTTRLVHPLLFSLEPWQVQRRTIPEKETNKKTKRNSCKHPHNCAVKPKQPHSATVLLKHCHGLHYSGKQKATGQEKHSSVLGLNTLSCLWNLKPRFFWEYYECLRLVASFEGYWIVQASINWHLLIGTTVRLPCAV